MKRVTTSSKAIAGVNKDIRQVASGILPKQQRSRESHERLVASAERLLAKSGARALTLAEVSRDSGVSIGGIYRRFESREALIGAVQQRIYDRIEQDWIGLEQDMLRRSNDLATRVRYLVAGLAELLRRYIPLIKAIVEATMSDPVIAARGRRFFHHSEKQFCDLLLPYQNDIYHEDPGHAARFCFGSVYELVASHFGVGGRSSDNHIGWPILISDLQRMCWTYLCVPTLDATGVARKPAMPTTKTTSARRKSRTSA